jgi:hypothetical protein
MLCAIDIAHSLVLSSDINSFISRKKQQTVINAQIEIGFLLNLRVSDVDIAVDYDTATNECLVLTWCGFAGAGNFNTALMHHIAFDKVW